jgi:hypothetical protein
MTDQTMIDKAFLGQIEDDLVQHIIKGLENKTLSVEDSRSLAYKFLQHLPAKDKQDLLDKLNELGKEYKPAQEVYADFIGDYAAKEREDKLNAMRGHIQSGNIEAAIAVAKGGN